LRTASSDVSEISKTPRGKNGIEIALVTGMIENAVTMTMIDEGTVTIEKEEEEEEERLVLANVSIETGTVMIDELCVCFTVVIVIIAPFADTLFAPGVCIA
jgi:hypothetical protein